MTLKLNRVLALLALCGAFAAPALAQSTPQETNLDQKAAQMEERNARGDQLTDVSSEQARANALRRCERLPEFYKQDCVARVDGEGEVSGTVVGGGQFRQSVTTMPKEDLDRALQGIGSMQLPASSD